jgi:hypothetical protein
VSEHSRSLKYLRVTILSSLMSFQSPNWSAYLNTLSNVQTIMTLRAYSPARSDGCGELYISRKLSGI